MSVCSSVSEVADTTKLNSNFSQLLSICQQKPKQMLRLRKQTFCWTFAVECIQCAYKSIKSKYDFSHSECGWCMVQLSYSIGVEVCNIIFMDFKVSMENRMNENSVYDWYSSVSHVNLIVVNEQLKYCYDYRYILTNLNKKNIIILNSQNVQLWNNCYWKNCCNFWQWAVVGNVLNGRKLKKCLRTKSKQKVFKTIQNIW